MDSVPVKKKMSPFVGWILAALGIGLLIGILVSLGLLYLPYDRVVVYGQPKSPAVLIRSVHLQKPGFIAVYIRDPGGLGLAGYSQYLVPGYYENMVIPIDFDVLTKYQGRSFLVRIYRDNGDKAFIEKDDTLLLQRNGEAYQKKFNFVHPEAPLKEWLSSLSDYPVSLIIDGLIP